MPRMNGRATGIAIHAITTSPMETMAPAFVPGTGKLPKASLCGSRPLASAEVLKHGCLLLRATSQRARPFAPLLLRGSLAALLLDDAEVAAGHIGGLRLA